MHSEERGNNDGVSIHAGFPNPATDSSLRSLDLNQLLIAHSASTYLFRIQGSEWEASGIFDGDIAIIDRALDARPSDIILWWNPDTTEFNLSTLKAAPENAISRGVVTATIHQLRKVHTRRG